MSKINETNYPRRPQSDYEDTDMLIIQEAGGNTYTTRIEDIREDCQEAIAPIVEAVNDALAPPENGSTASQSYAIGEHFMRNGAFCTAIAAITSGASFTLNTNYVVGTIAEALESLNSDIAKYGKTSISNSSVANATGSMYRSGQHTINISSFGFSAIDYANVTCYNASSGYVVPCLTDVTTSEIKYVLLATTSIASGFSCDISYEVKGH